MLQFSLFVIKTYGLPPRALERIDKLILDNSVDFFLPNLKRKPIPLASSCIKINTKHLITTSFFTPIFLLMRRYLYFASGCRCSNECHYGIEEEKPVHVSVYRVRYCVHLHFLVSMFPKKATCFIIQDEVNPFISRESSYPSLIMQDGVDIFEKLFFVLFWGWGLSWLCTHLF